MHDCKWGKVSHCRVNTIHWNCAGLYQRHPTVESVLFIGTVCGCNGDIVLSDECYSLELYVVVTTDLYWRVSAVHWRVVVLKASYYRSSAVHLNCVWSQQKKILLWRQSHVFVVHMSLSILTLKHKVVFVLTQFSV